MCVVCTCVCYIMHVCVCGGQRSTSGVLSESPPCYLRQALSVNRSSSASQPGCPFSSRDPHLQVLVLGHVQHLTSDPNPHSHAHTRRTSLAEPSSQPYTSGIKVLTHKHGHGSLITRTHGRIWVWWCMDPSTEEQKTGSLD